MENQPSIDKNYRCGTCGNESGEEHPVTGYCWHCDTDNWIANDSDFLR